MVHRGGADLRECPAACGVVGDLDHRVKLGLRGGRHRPISELLEVGDQQHRLGDARARHLHGGVVLREHLPTGGHDRVADLDAGAERGDVARGRRLVDRGALGGHRHRAAGGVAAARGNDTGVQAGQVALAARRKPGALDGGDLHRCGLAGGRQDRLHRGRAAGVAGDCGEAVQPCGGRVGGGDGVAPDGVGGAICAAVGVPHVQPVVVVGRLAGGGVGAVLLLQLPRRDDVSVEAGAGGELGGELLLAGG